MKLAKAGNSQWALPLAALTSGLRHMGLSQFAMRELLVLEGELQRWHATAPLVRARTESQSPRGRARLSTAAPIAALGGRGSFPC